MIALVSVVVGAFVCVCFLPSIRKKIIVIKQNRIALQMMLLEVTMLCLYIICIYNLYILQENIIEQSVDEVSTNTSVEEKIIEQPVDEVSRNTSVKDKIITVNHEEQKATVDVMLESHNHSQRTVSIPYYISSIFN